MKTTIYFIITILLFATACQKEEYVIPQSNVAATDTVWNLSMQIPELEINFRVNASEMRTLFANHNVPIGSDLTFTSSSDKMTVSIARLYDGTTAQLTGSIRGHTFIMVENKLNICGGSQQISFTYQINQ